MTSFTLPCSVLLSQGLREVMIQGHFGAVQSER